MGMLDSENILSAAQAETTVADHASTNIYDTGQTNASVGLTGENLWLVVAVKTATTTSAGGTVTPVLQDSADNSSYTDVMVGPLAAAPTAAGTYLWRVQLPIGVRRYIRVVYRIATGALTAGAFDAYVSNTIQANTSHPSGFTVS